MNHDAKLLQALEPSQLAAIAEKPLPRRRLDRFTLGLLIALRIYVIVAIPIVAYAFVHALRTAK